MEQKFKAEQLKVKGFGNSAQLLTDEETGVQYLFFSAGYGGGLTVRVDQNGKPMIDPEFVSMRL
ncbi:DUF6440 family protein [Christensenellaceae bacterium OttesenSCG-928-L17]|nr:DUF6440 family protein [Christensenellaceae bacterium OttesenSCG-928-L17]